MSPSYVVQCGPDVPVPLESGAVDTPVRGVLDRDVVDEPSERGASELHAANMHITSASAALPTSRIRSF